MNEDLEKLELRSVADGNAKWAVPLDNSKAVSHKVKHSLYSPTIPLLGVYPSEMKVYVPHITNVSHCQTLEKIKTFIHR